MMLSHIRRSYLSSIYVRREARDKFLNGFEIVLSLADRIRWFLFGIYEVYELWASTGMFSRSLLEINTRVALGIRYKDIVKEKKGAKSDSFKDLISMCDGLSKSKSPEEALLIVKRRYTDKDDLYFAAGYLGLDYAIVDTI